MSTKEELLESLRLRIARKNFTSEDVKVLGLQSKLDNLYAQVPHSFTSKDKGAGATAYFAICLHQANPDKLDVADELKGIRISGKNKRSSSAPDIAVPSVPLIPLLPLSTALFPTWLIEPGNFTKAIAILLWLSGDAASKNTSTTPAASTSSHWLVDVIDQAWTERRFVCEKDFDRVAPLVAMSDVKIQVYAMADLYVGQTVDGARRRNDHDVRPCGKIAELTVEQKAGYTWRCLTPMTKVDDFDFALRYELLDLFEYLWIAALGKKLNTNGMDPLKNVGPVKERQNLFDAAARLMQPGDKKPYLRLLGGKRAYQ